MAREASRKGGRSEGGCLGTNVRRSAFIHTLTETGSVALAAAAADRKLSTCYRWRAENADFAAAWAAALEVGYDRLESALLGHALKTMACPLVDMANGANGANRAEGAEGGPAADQSDAGAPEAGERSISNADLQFVTGVVVRHRAAAKREKPEPKRGKAPTREEVDAALKRALDGLARRVAAP